LQILVLFILYYCTLLQLHLQVPGEGDSRRHVGSVLGRFRAPDLCCWSHLSWQVFVSRSVLPDCGGRFLKGKQTTGRRRSVAADTQRGWLARAAARTQIRGYLYSCRGMWGWEKMIDRGVGLLVASVDLLPRTLILTLAWQSRPPSVDLLVVSGDILPLQWTPSVQR